VSAAAGAAAAAAVSTAGAAASVAGASVVVASVASLLQATKETVTAKRTIRDLMIFILKRFDVLKIFLFNC
jgi:hypothetical protein